jgi:hypothetical protein
VFSLSVQFLFFIYFFVVVSQGFHNFEGGGQALCAGRRAVLLFRTRQAVKKIELCRAIDQ